MALSYRAALNANLRPLAEAVAKWRVLPGQFQTIGTTFQTSVINGLRESDWTGDSADAAFTKLNSVKKQIHAASEEAKSIYSLLNGALDSFRSAQTRLKSVAKEISEDRNLRIAADGTVYIVPPEKDPARVTQIQNAYQETLRAYSERISRALNDAREADTALHWALSQDHNGRDRGFNGDTYRSLTSAAAARKQAVEDLRTATEIAALGPDITPEQTARLNSILTKREGDPYFSEHFAVRIGPKGVLQLWTNLANSHQGDPTHLKTLKNLQKSLGFTLATATHSNSSAIQTWKKEVVALGSERIEILNPGRPGVSRPYGFQVMSSLLRYGEYETGFLKNYGTELIGFERTFKNINPEGLWHSYATHLPLNIDGTDLGKDPMAGYLQALGHNPEAAKALFYSKEWVNVNDHNADFEYLLKEREWPHDPVPGKDPALGYGHEELGKALEAATLGVPYDEVGLQRDKKAANVMSQVVWFVSENPDFVESNPEILTSLTKMGAAYIDDLNWAIAIHGGAAKAVDHDLLFENDGLEHIRVDEPIARAFLKEVGQHSGSYETLSAAQHAYTISVMEYYANDSLMAQNAANTGAYNHGVLDDARVSRITEEYKSQAEKATLELEKAAEWKKLGMGQGVGITAGLMTLPLGGPGAAAATAVVVPMAVDVGVAAFNTYWGNESSEDLKQNSPDFSTDIQRAMDKYKGLGKDRAWNPLESYLDLHNNLSRKEMSESYNQTINAYERGWNS